ncbi:MAG: agmatine deiminase family protein [Candidatus Cloacimonas sp.]|jgi:agmatine/peptidylarginine deiminase|nr:agmatine deiminase family protein [Candidatus Cloacimonas sp.]
MKLSPISRIILLLSTMLLCSIALSAHKVLPGDLEYTGIRFTETNPPVAPVRPVAEFEPASQVLIRYPLGIPVSLVTQFSNTTQVVCVVSSSQQSAANSAFSNAGANMANISYLNAATDSYWTRDFGPWFMCDGNGEFGVVDYVYNRPRPNDNLIPQIFAQQQNWNYFGMNLTQTGGNYMSDGINTAAQTTIAYTENGNNQTNVNTKMQSYLGITNYHVMQDPNNTYIDHIDCWGKFLAPDKVLIRSVPTSHAQYSAIEATANYFASLNCAWGYPYRVYRVNTPSNQPYTNSVILNKKVFVPIMGGSYDAAALQVYRDAMPGYEVIGVINNTSTPWESTDALHCRAHEIPDKSMLHIAHTPWHGVLPLNSDITINTNITANSGQPIYSDSTFVCYKVNSGAWQRSYLQSSTRNLYNTALSGFAMGDTIRYFIHAADQSGHSYDHPVFAALDPHIFVMQGDVQGPVLSHMPITNIGNQADPISIVLNASDDSGISQVLFRYKTDDSQVYSFPMDELSEGSYVFQYYPEFVSGDSYFYYSFVAFDATNPPNMSVLPETGSWYQVPVNPVANSDLNIPAICEGIKSVYPIPSVLVGILA